MPPPRSSLPLRGAGFTLLAKGSPVIDREDSPAPTMINASNLRRLLPVAFRAAFRLLQALLLLATVVFLVTLAMTLARGGGWRTLSGVLPEIASTMRTIATAVLQGEAEAYPEMWRALPKSLVLLALSSLFGSALGAALGGFAAARRGSRLSSILANLSVLGISTPSYVAAMFLIWTVVWGYGAAGIRLLPVFGFGWDEHLLLPLIVLAARPAANMMRLTQSTLVAVFETDYVRTAHSKGLRPRTVFWRHVLRSAGVPLVTSAAVSLRFTLSTLPIVEFIFAWPGLGLLLLQAVRGGELETVLVMLLPLVILFISVNLTVDLLYRFIDPRLNEEGDSPG